MAAPLSVKRREIFQFIAAAGQRGVSQSDIREKFFRDRSPTTIRTTIHYINSVIRPMRIAVYGKRMWLTKKD